MIVNKHDRIYKKYVIFCKNKYNSKDYEMFYNQFVRGLNDNLDINMKYYKEINDLIYKYKYNERIKNN